MTEPGGFDPGYALVLHGGAGARRGRDYELTESHLRTLAAAGQCQLAAGAGALDVVEQAVAAMEGSGYYVAGRGSAPNSAGYVELDAAIMDGQSQAAGAVAALRDVVHPISVARAVMEQTSHVMLVGQGALEFARSREFAEVADPATYYTLPVGVDGRSRGPGGHGTVGAVALDGSGRLAAATSTGGTFGKLPGRVGDSPLIGPGTWADAHLALSCTGTGEHIIRAGGAAAVAWRVRGGMALHDAMAALLADVQRLGGEAGIIAVCATGEMAALFNSEGMKRASVSSGVPLQVATF